MMINLELLDYQIFMHLRDDPLISLNELSKTLSITYHQVRERIFKMKASGFLRPDREIQDPLLGKRKQTEVEARYKPHTLGLQRIHVIFEKVPTIQEAKTLFKLADIHPYTHYKTMVFTPSPSVYLQFDIPPSTTQTLLSMFEKLKSKNYFHSFFYFPTITSSTSKLNFTFWDRFEQKWFTADVKENIKHRNVIQSFWEGMQDHIKNPISKESYTLKTHEPPKLDELDLNLIRELSINAKISQKELGKYYNKNNSTISKRLKKLMNKQKLLATLYYDRNIFNINEQLIIIGKLSSSDLIPYFHTFLQEGYFPFTSTFINQQTEFFWYVNLPNGVMPDLLMFLWDKTHSYKLLFINFKKSSTYYFYPKNYDIITHSWKSEKAYVMDEPLATLLDE